MNRPLYILSLSAASALVTLFALWAVAQGPARAEAAFQAALAVDVCTLDVAQAEAHSHPVRNVAEGIAAPRVTHLVFPDAVDGYNVQILTENFTFTPAAINGPVAENSGHGHLYVNGEKIARLYGDWVHLPAAELKPGVNLVSVTLNANDHSVWAEDGQPISTTVRVILPDATSASDTKDGA